MVVGGGVGVPGTRYDIGVGFEIGYEVDHDGRACGDVVSICWCWRPCGGVIYGGVGLLMLAFAVVVVLLSVFVVLVSVFVGAGICHDTGVDVSVGV